jgi:hypothetical protein
MNANHGFTMLSASKGLEGNKAGQDERKFWHHDALCFLEGRDVQRGGDWRLGGEV